MERKYPPKLFYFGILLNFIFHFFYLFIPGVILCIVGIWNRACLCAGLALLVTDLFVSYSNQVKIRNAVMNSTHPDVKPLADALCGPGGLEAFDKVLNERIESMKRNEEEDVS